MHSIIDTQRPANSSGKDVYTQLGKRLNEGLYRELSRVESLRPSLTSAKVLAFAASGIVHGVTLGLALVGLLLITTSWPNVLIMSIGLLCAWVAWVLMPRFPSLRGEAIARSEFPALNKVVVGVAEALGTSDVHAIVINEGFNAAFSQVGWRRERVLYLGLPLLSVLDSQDLIAIVGHELAHGINGDPARGFFVGSALNSLHRWYELLIPDHLWRSTRRWNQTDGLLAIPGNLLRLVLAGAVHLWLRLLTHLVWRESQRAEYLADYLAASVGGTGAMVSALEKLQLSGTFYTAVQTVSLGNSRQNLFTELQRRVAEAPKNSLEVLRASEQPHIARLESTHPPTSYRMDLLLAHPIARANFTLSEGDFEQLKRELEPLKPPIQKRLVDKHSASLYYS